MGVEYHSCDKCSEARYEEYVGRCTSCYASLCTHCVVNDDIDSIYASQYGVIFDGSEEQRKEYDIKDEHIEKGWYVIGEKIDDSSIAPQYCPYCQCTAIDESRFVKFLVAHIGKPKEELETMYLEEKRLQNG
ncbi:hypothetical protein [Bacillus thuringiensis]|uniref:hypothetical protein n=1 Tax=Bacillus thuringiensis TaxID=1428 RepID=UPI000BF5A630|nr:hypothetical protein [Bacillus thuringiensis]PFC28468.1 hypothetical protein CN299_19550 [Bacillus thuringiensis]